MPSSGIVVITVRTDPARKNVTPRAVLFFDDDVNRIAVRKVIERPASIPTMIEPMIPTTSKTTNSVRIIEARARIRSIEPLSAQIGRYRRPHECEQLADRLHPRQRGRIADVVDGEAKVFEDLLAHAQERFDQRQRVDADIAE